MTSAALSLPLSEGFLALWDVYPWLGPGLECAVLVSTRAFDGNCTVATGWCLDCDGFVACTAHQVAHMNTLWLSRLVLDAPSKAARVSTLVQAECVYEDPKADIAILRVNGEQFDVTATPATSSLSLFMGDAVIAVGVDGNKAQLTACPLGRPWLKAKGSHVLEGREYALDRLVFAEGQVEHGCSGAMVCDVRTGTVVGMAAFICELSRYGCPEPSTGIVPAQEITFAHSLARRAGSQSAITTDAGELSGQQLELAWWLAGKDRVGRRNLECNPRSR